MNITNIRFYLNNFTVLGFLKIFLTKSKCLGPDTNLLLIAIILVILVNKSLVGANIALYARQPLVAVRIHTRALHPGKTAPICKKNFFLNPVISSR